MHKGLCMLCVIYNVLVFLIWIIKLIQVDISVVWNTCISVYFYAHTHTHTHKHTFLYLPFFFVSILVIINADVRPK